MKKIGVVTVGQSPRTDVVPSMMEVFGKGVEVLESGGLDNYTLQDADEFGPKPGQGGLVSRMRDGTEVRISHDFIVPHIQKCIEDLEKKGVELTLVLCTGRFPSFNSKRLVVYPSDILRGVVTGAIKRGRLAVVMPSTPQRRSTPPREVPGEPKPWGEEVEVIYDGASPYGPEQAVSQMADRLAAAKVDLTFLNCVGFNSRHKEIVKTKTGKPVIQSNTLIARVLKELIS